MIIRGQCWVGILETKGQTGRHWNARTFSVGENVLLPAVLDLLNLDLP